MDETPNVMMAMLKKICPAALVSLSGGYAVQPESQPPAACEASRSTATGGTIQKLRALTRGKAISRAPIIRGTK